MTVLDFPTLDGFWSIALAALMICGVRLNPFTGDLDLVGTTAAGSGLTHPQVMSRVSLRF
jgi:hypothetical protein